MKTMKKLASLLLALAMIFSLATTAFAEGEGTTPTKNDSITVNGAKAGETYKLYQMFDLVVDNEEDPSSYYYTINNDWTDFFATDGAGAAYIETQAIGNTSYVKNITDAAALAKAAAAWANKPAAFKSVTVAEDADAAVFSNLPDGYWLITSTLGTVAMTRTTPADSDVTVNEKNPEDTIKKEVQEDSNSSWGKNNDAQVGDPVEFRSTVKIVKGTRNVVVHDKMDSGLTYTTGSVAIEGLTKGTEYTVNENPGHDDTFDITFTQSWIDGLDFGTAGYKEYVITYTATLNENAVVKGDNGVAIVDQNNKTHVSYGDNTNSTEDTTTTTTHNFSVFKYYTTDNTTKTHLAGAKFQLKKDNAVVELFKIDDNNYRIAVTGDEDDNVVTEFITVANGDIVIWGVDDDDTYTLVETEPPIGYNQLKDPVSVTFKTDGTATRIDVENKFGTELPSTGGMGTTLFYVVGGILVAAAAVLLVTKKRMAN